MGSDSRDFFRHSPGKARWKADCEAFHRALPEPLRGEMAAARITVTAIHALPTPLPPEPSRSSYGGSPFLAPEAEWPVHQGRPLDFLAQINLEEVRRWLPNGVQDSGILSFFYDRNQPVGDSPEDLGSGRILFNQDFFDVVQVDLPSGKPTRRQALRFREIPAEYMSDSLSDRYYTYLESLPEEERMALWKLHDCALDTDHSDHRLFSSPYLPRGEMTSSLEVGARAWGLPESTPWTMVLQLGGLADQDWWWEKDGSVSFWVPSVDLKQSRFDRVWVVRQCR